MTLSEMAWWAAMSSVRSTPFLVVFLTLTLLDWTQGGRLGDPEHIWWNLVASALAILVEQTVGRSMTWLALKDSAIARKSNKELVESHREMKDMQAELHTKIDRLLADARRSRYCPNCTPVSGSVRYFEDTPALVAPAPVAALALEDQHDLSRLADDGCPHHA